MREWLRMWAHCLAHTFSSSRVGHRWMTHRWRFRGPDGRPGAWIVKHFCSCGFNA